MNRKAVALFTKRLSSFARRLLVTFGALILLNVAGSAQVVPSPGVPQIGTSQPATAYPKIKRPATQPCVVNLYQNFVFANFDDKPFSFTPPAGCVGPWRKVVFTADFTVSVGRQFDRTARVFLGGANIYFGTTAQPRATLSPSWHVERDVTDFTALFNRQQAGKVTLGNFIGVDNGITYDGIIYGNAALEFYPASAQEPAPKTPDIVIPIPDNNAYSLETPSSVLNQQVSLPTNIEKAFLDVVPQSQGGDEFWWTCVPDNRSEALQSCGGTGFREGQVAVDTRPAGIVPVYPWIYTGGVSPSLWTPLPGLQTFNFEPYRVNLTPFAGMLSDGRPHYIGVSVFNANGRFDVTGNLFIYLDPFASQITGETTRNDLSPAANPVVSDTIQTAANGDLSGNVAVTSDRSFAISGYINTSHGRVETTVRQTVNFVNSQAFTINSNAYSQRISQATVVDSHTRTRDGSQEEIVTQRRYYPFTFNFESANNANSVESNQSLLLSDTTTSNGTPTYQKQTTDTVVSSVGATGRKSSHTYSVLDSLTNCYNNTVNSADGLVTTFQEQQSCPVPLSPQPLLPLSEVRQ